MQTLRPKEGAPASKSSVPILAALPLHRPGTAWIGKCRPPARDDALGAKPASVGENRRAVLRNVFVEQDAGLDTAQQLHQRGLPVEKRAIAQMISIVWPRASMRRAVASAVWTKLD